MNKNLEYQSSDRFFELCQDLLSQGRAVRFTAQGRSMAPCIRDGDQVRVEPLNGSAIQAGDIVMARTANGQLLVHRVIDGPDQKGDLLLGGDNCLGRPEAVPANTVLGRLTAIERQGCHLSLNTLRHKLLSRVQLGLSPCKNRLLPWLLRLKRSLARGSGKGWTAEDRLLLHYCGQVVHGTRTGVSRQQPPADWPAFIAKARQEGVSQLLYQALNRDQGGEEAPPWLMGELSRDYYATATRNTRFFVELGKLLAACNRAELPIMVLKGAVLAELFHDNLGLRAMSDIDLLVRRQDLSELDRLLTKAGYHSKDLASIDRAAAPDNYLTTVLYTARFPHGPSFHLHWHWVNSSMPNQGLISRMETKRVWQAARPVIIAGQQTLVMAPHHLLIHLAEHSLRVTHSLARLSYFCDIAVVIDRWQQEIDWTLLETETIRFGIAPLIYFPLSLAKELLGASVPQGLLDRLHEEKFGACERFFQAQLAKNRRFVGLSYILHLSLCQGFRAKIRFLARTLAPPRPVLAQRHGVAREAITIKHYLGRFCEVGLAGLRFLTSNGRPP